MSLDNLRPLSAASLKHLADCGYSVTPVPVSVLLGVPVGIAQPIDVAPPRMPKPPTQRERAKTLLRQANRPLLKSTVDAALALVKAGYRDDEIVETLTVRR